MPFASRTRRAFFGIGFWRMPTTTTRFSAIAACTSRTMSEWLLARVSRIAGWMWASSRMLRGMADSFAGFSRGRLQRNAVPARFLRPVEGLVGQLDRGHRLQVEVFPFGHADADGHREDLL